uniref:Uncharacterized protein n=2 Tax=Rubinisphaera brasiliensis TaxID=119 RepID=F0SS41_RUBBR|nr:hypothetical protein Plabr_3792 [Rubinisphaera brasiliensis DSM 5305]
MDKQDRLILRVATDIADNLHLSRSSTVPNLPAHLWRQTEKFHRQQQHAAQRNWRAAHTSVNKNMVRSLEALQQELSATLNKLHADTPIFTAGIRDIYGDLKSLEREFTSLSIDRKRREITVETEVIELEGIYLGRFEICLNYSDAATDSPPSYRVVALDPNPASSNDSVTHPHVQDETVCEGEAYHPIRTALLQGRIYDFFVIVAGLLRTYNSASPFVSLSDWNGISCADCGTSTYDDERWSCEKCDAYLCDECHMHCPDCDGTYCCECTTRCQSCEDRRCRSCIEVCSACLDEFCQSCLEENGKCETCHEKETKANEPEHRKTESPTDTEIHAHRVGEVAVPA